MNSPSRKWIWLVPIGALGGGFLATWIAPKVIGWYFEPPAQFGFNCRAPIEWALNKMMWSQGVGFVAGALGGLVIYVTLARRQRARSAEHAPQGY